MKLIALLVFLSMDLRGLAIPQALAFGVSKHSSIKCQNELTTERPDHSREELQRVYGDERTIEFIEKYKTLIEIPKKDPSFNNAREISPADILNTYLAYLQGDEVLIDPHQKELIFAVWRSPILSQLNGNKGLANQTAVDACLNYFRAAVLQHIATNKILQGTDVAWYYNGKALIIVFNRLKDSRENKSPSLEYELKSITAKAAKQLREALEQTTLPELYKESRGMLKDPRWWNLLAFGSTEAYSVFHARISGPRGEGSQAAALAKGAGPLVLSPRELEEKTKEIIGKVKTLRVQIEQRFKALDDRTGGEFLVPVTLTNGKTKWTLSEKTLAVFRKVEVGHNQTYEGVVRKRLQREFPVLLSHPISDEEILLLRDFIQAAEIFFSEPYQMERRDLDYSSGLFGSLKFDKKKAWLIQTSLAIKALARTEDKDIDTILEEQKAAEKEATKLMEDDDEHIEESANSSLPYNNEFESGGDDDEDRDGEPPAISSGFRPTKISLDRTGDDGTVKVNARVKRIGFLLFMNDVLRKQLDYARRHQKPLVRIRLTFLPKFFVGTDAKTIEIDNRPLWFTSGESLERAVDSELQEDPRIDAKVLNKLMFTVDIRPKSNAEGTVFLLVAGELPQGAPRIAIQEALEKTLPRYFPNFHGKAVFAPPLYED